MIAPPAQILFAEYVPYMRDIVLAEDKANALLLVDPYSNTNNRPSRTRVTRSANSLLASKFSTFNTKEWLRQTRMTEAEEHADENH